MMAMLSWTDPKMPALHRQGQSGKAWHRRHGQTVAIDQSQSLSDFISAPDANNAGISDANKVVTLPSNF
jgi:hypothetical protein